MKIITKAEIEKILPTLDPIPAIEQGFVEYSQGKCNIPPVGELIMETGDIHIKYGCINKQDFYVIKIASGFFDTGENGPMTSDGMMMVFSQKTGAVLAILHDE